MDTIFLVFTIINLFILNTLSQNDDEEINEGASTSRVLTVHEVCEIESYGVDTARLLLAEDIGGGNLTEIMNNRFHELQAFHDQVHSYYVLAEYGPRIENDENFRNKRLEFYHRILQQQLSQVFGLACLHHLNFRLWYEYDNETNLITGGEKIYLAVRGENCLCNNYEERMMLSESFRLPAIQRSEKTIQIFRNSTGVSVMEVSEYHIIPVLLISRFFQVWLPDVLDTTPDVSLNGCLLILMARLRRSIQKLLIVQIKNYGAFSFDEWYEVSSNLTSNMNSNFFSVLFSRANHWLRGNIFLGPTNRGPFNPEFGRNDEDLQRAFENDASFIIGKVRSRGLRSLHENLLEFIRLDRSMTHLDRLTIGFDLFNWMMVLLIRHDVTPMKIEQWEERKPKNQELSNVHSAELRRFMKTQKYWAIKKSHPRPKRSEIDHTENYDYLPAKEALTVEKLRQVWSDFVMNLTLISINAQSQNETLNWSCNFTRLHDDYILHKSEYSKSDDMNCVMTFDKYLLAKINSTWDWHLCNSAVSILVAESEWCRAWKRIRMQYTLKNSVHYSNSKLHSKSYLQDAETFMQWLFSQIKLRECEKKEKNLSNLPSLKKSSVRLYSPVRDDSIDSILHYLSISDMESDHIKKYGFIVFSG